MGWYDDLEAADQALARMNPAGLAVIHTQPFAEDSGKRWVLFPYLRHITEVHTPLLLDGGKGMLFMPPRHGKSLYSSVYTPAWYVMQWQTRNVIITSYGEDLAAGFSVQARKVVEDLGHLFGVRVHPKVKSAKHWQVQYVDAKGTWHDGGNVYAAGVDGALPGRGGHLIVMDDVVRGHRDTTPAMMEKAYRWYRGVLETRREPGGTVLLVMTRWAQADLAGRLLEDEGEQWHVTTLPALAKDDDVLGREPGTALCPQRFSSEELRAKRDSSDEGGILFAALYQQEPMPEDGAVFKPEHMHRWAGVGRGMVQYANNVVPMHSLRLRFATVDPALKGGERNDPTGFLVWTITPDGHLVLLEDRTRRMNGTDDLLPAMKDAQRSHPGIVFYVEDNAHGTEVIRACIREGIQVLPVTADRDKVTRAISAQPAFSAGKVHLPALGVDALVRELLEFPGGRHDDRVDCVSHATTVWRDRTRHLHGREYAEALGDVMQHPRLARGGSAASWRTRTRWREAPTTQPRRVAETQHDMQNAHPLDRLPRRAVRARDRWTP